MNAVAGVIRLGQEVFILSPDGEVTRTMVAELNANGYRLLNGWTNHNKHWFSFEEAISAADKRLEAEQAALRKELRPLAKKRHAIQTQSYRAGVMNTRYRVADLRDTMSPRRPRRLKKVCVPEEYLVPQTMVYVVITTQPSKHGDQLYRPHPCFVLETKVTNVCLTPDGEVSYTFSTRFIVGDFFLTRQGAETRLRDMVGDGVMGTGSVPFVSNEEEQKELDKIDDIPF